MNIRTYLKTSGLRETQIDDIERPFRAWRQQGVPPETALLAALYVWGPSNRKRCRSIARGVVDECHRQGFVFSQKEAPIDHQAYAVLGIHALVVDSRCKDPQTVLETAIRTRQSKDPRIQAILERVYQTWIQ